MAESARTLHRTRVYFAVVFAVLALGLVLGLIFLDQAPWILILTGCLLGGFLVDALVALAKHRRIGHRAE